MTTRGINLSIKDKYDQLFMSLNKVNSGLSTPRLRLLRRGIKYSEDQNYIKLV